MINFHIRSASIRPIVHECTLMCNRPILRPHTFTQKRVPVVPPLRFSSKPHGSSKFKVQEFKRKSNSIGILESQELTEA